MDGSIETELRKRLSLGRTAMTKLKPIMKKHDVSLNTKVMIVTSMVFPVVLYRAESWTLNLQLKRKLNAFELWCWRRVLHITWKDKVTNEEVIRRISPKITLEATALKQKLTYFGHVMRSKNGMGRDIMLGKTEGKRRRGRQRTRWIEDVKNSTGRRLAELKEISLNRSGWRRVVHNVTRGRPRPDGL